MIDERSAKSLYVQIAEFVVEKILNQELTNSDKLFSVRELADIAGVNVNTVQRAYNLLVQQKILVKQRGRGFFVAPDGLEISQKSRRSNFINEDLINFMKNLRILNIPFSDIEERYQQYIKLNFA